MNNVSLSDVSRNPALLGFMARNALPVGDLRSDGRLTLTLDGKYRVQVHPAGPNRLALTADLLSLAGRSEERGADAALERLMGMNAGLLREHAATLVLDARRQELMLQQSFAATAAEAVEQALAEFVNVLPFWKSVCAAEAGLLNA